MSDAPTLHPKRHPDTSFRKIGEEGGLVVLPGRSEVKVLNPAGIVVFSMLDGTRGVDELAAAVAGEFEIAIDDARKDVVEFLGDLRRNGMLAEVATVSEERPS